MVLLRDSQTIHTEGLTTSALAKTDGQITGDTTFFGDSRCIEYWFILNSGIDTILLLPSF